MVKQVVYVVSVIISFLCFVFVGCSNKHTTEMVAIEMVETFYLDDVSANLPEIKIGYNDNTQKIVGFENFWFNAQYTYVHDGRIHAKSGAPYIFNDEMLITHKNDKNIKTTINIIKRYVPLDSIDLMAKNDALTCKQGETLQLMLDFVPANASYGQSENL